MWVHVFAHGGTISAGLFVNLAQCISDAKSLGFEEAKWERRKAPRIAARAVQNHPNEHHEGS